MPNMPVMDFSTAALGFCLFYLVIATLGGMLDKKIGIFYNVVPLVLIVSLLMVSIFVSPRKEPIWRNKPCLVMTPTDHLIGFQDYRNKLIVQDYRQYRCS